MKYTLILQISLMLLVLTAGLTNAQECGPSCPVCSGGGSSDGALLSPKSVLLSGLSIPDAEEETAVINVRYGILKWLDAGFGYALDTEKALWNVRMQPIFEQGEGWMPGIILGTGSVQTGGSDQSLYAQLIKSVKISDLLDLRLSAGTATLLPDFDESYGLAGVTASFRNRFAIFANYDGQSYHEGLSWIPLDMVTISFMMVESEEPALSVVFKI